MDNGVGMAKPKVFIACGGSGLATLDRMCQLLAEDQYWRREAQTSLYFLLIDTDERDLQTFNQTFQMRFGELAGNISRQSVLLSQGVTDIGYLLTRWFVRPFENQTAAPALAAKERLYKHWWTASGEPECPMLEESLRYGAGQCPPISYFLAWHQFPNITNAISRIMSDIVTKRGGGNQGDIDIYLLAGLAGGTGRGCWMPVAYAMRDYIVRRQLGAPQIRGVFFDFSVLRDVYEKSEQAEKRRMQINAITGWSELSCWVEQDNNIAGSDKFTYELPSMENPGSNLADVLTVEIDIRRRTSPITQVYMMFADCNSAVLRKKNDFYSIAGNALYTRLRAERIQQGEINQDRRAYRNIASAIIEVPASSLRLYIEVESQARLLDPPKVKDSNIESLVIDFLKDTRLGPGSASSVGIDRPETEFYRHAIERLYDSKCKPVRDGLNSALSKNDKIGVVSQLTKIENISLKDQDIEPLWSADNDIKKRLEQVFKERNGGGVLAAREFAQRLSERLKTVAVNLPDDIRIPGDQTAIKHRVDELASRTFVEQLTGKPSFNEMDRRAVLDQARHQFEAIHDTSILTFMKTRLNGLIDVLERFQRRCDQVIRCNYSVAKTLRDQLRRGLGLQPDQDVFKTLFVSPNEPEETLPALDDESIFVRRVLRPMMTSEDFDTLLRDKHVVNAEPLADYWLTVCLGESEPPGETTMKQQIAEKVAAAVDHRSDFIVENFGLLPVLERARSCWSERRKQLVNQRDKFDAINARFTRFYGFSMPYNTHEDFPDPEEMLCSMAKALAHACQPFWLRRHVGEDVARVTVILPPGSANISINDDPTVKYVVPAVGGGSDGNPFVVMAYSSDGVDDIDQIASLDYYGEVANDLRLLEKSHEDKEAADQFKKRRVGYATPIYLREEALRINRWCPWADSSVDDRVNSDLLAAVEHAVFDFPEGFDNVRDKVASLGWSFPLVKVGQNKWMQFTRRALRLSAHGPSARPEEDIMGCDWPIGENFVQGLVKFRDHLRDKSGYIRLLLEERKAFEEMILHHLGKAKWNEIVNARIKALDEEIRKIQRDDPQTADCLKELKTYLAKQLALAA
ncbi:MAG: tubulin-like doman-containing protein [Candidatus Sumerlaeaceae bacterium]|nr:tubulin-like doman-containing protein [Candidatus Sumerlaeaceae bacterium]